MLLVCLCLGFILWIIWYGVECKINGSDDIFLSLSQEISWLYSKKNKARYIKDIVEDNGNGAMCSSFKSWSYRQIRDGNLYSEVADAMLPGWKHFFFTHIVCPLFPLLVYLALGGNFEN